MKQKILSYLPGDFPWQVHWFDTIDSTNTYAKTMAQNGAPHGTVLVAGAQTKGRGRMGRSFSSPADKGIYLSVILRPDVPAQKLMHLTCAVAVAVCDAVEAVCGYRPGIKWINDLIAHNKKLGGILTELSVDPGSGLTRYAVVGIGINCCQIQEDFPEDIRDTAISLQTVTGKPVCRYQLVAAMIRSLKEMDSQLLAEQTAIMDAYRKDCITLGREVMLLRDETQCHAIAVDIESDGALLVKPPDGTQKRICSGEARVRGISGYI